MTARWMRGPRTVQSTTLVFVVAILGALALAGACSASSLAAASVKSAQRGSVRLSGSPGVPVANPRTNTVYVPIQCRASFCSTPAAGRVVDVVSAARCNAKNVVRLSGARHRPVGKNRSMPCLTRRPTRSMWSICRQRLGAERRALNATSPAAAPGRSRRSLPAAGSPWRARSIPLPGRCTWRV